jgi:DNA ligase-1
LTRGSRWNELTYNIFEVPEAEGNLIQRLSNVKESRYLKLIKQIKVKNKKHLQNFLKTIEDKKGEGVVVRDGSLPYYTGRDNNSLKVKSFLDDECIVVEHLSGKGKYKNKLGSIKCKLKSGRIIKIGSGFSDPQRKKPPKLGSIITFKYYGFTSKGNPRFPVFLRERK